MVMRKMISRKDYSITWDSDGPSLIVRILGQNCCNDQERGKRAAYNFIHASILMESIIFPPEARFAGKKPATAAAIKSQMGVIRIWAQGI